MISDGECYAWIHDMAVLFSYRKQAIGRTIMEKLQEGNENLLIGSTSSFEAVDFYINTTNNANWRRPVTFEEASCLLWYSMVPG